MAAPINVEELMARREARMAQSRREERAAAVSLSGNGTLKIVFLWGAAAVSFGCVVHFLAMIFVEGIEIVRPEGTILQSMIVLLLVSLLGGLLVYYGVRKALEQTETLQATAERFWALDQEGRAQVVAMIASMDDQTREVTH